MPHQLICSTGLRTTTEIASPASAFTGARPINSPWSPARKIFLFQVMPRAVFKNCATSEDTLAWSTARQSTLECRVQTVSTHPRIPERRLLSSRVRVAVSIGCLLRYAHHRIQKCLVKAILAMTKQLVFRPLPAYTISAHRAESAC